MDVIWQYSWVVRQTIYQRFGIIYSEASNGRQLEKGRSKRQGEAAKNLQTFCERV